jgi:hypothetical protein
MDLLNIPGSTKDTSSNNLQAAAYHFRQQYTIAPSHHRAHIGGHLKSALPGEDRAGHWKF